MLLHNHLLINGEQSVNYYTKKSYFHSEGNLVEIYSVNKQIFYSNSSIVEDEVMAAKLTETPIEQLTSEYKLVLEMGTYDDLASSENISEKKAYELVKQIEIETTIH
ncbi:MULTISPECIES: hypothetical protein [Niallia]|uniref:Uncharacterized protein n=1 Tax=Niallia taxi TaxID=2499688 RepID=A0A3S2TSP6_9BACI|nr:MULTISPECIES: hypothetical protein [Niallia]MDK8642468.1 hypothetical protein [Niallia taxi]MED4040554.1 hypothetical protein [Niallia taxi]MED4056994.1 hypothetical protein [Niallia taxi]MED4121660.1 hypothetical protein [Niallia taxi]RVT59510.1 hypothetical protein EM808_19645 [Niallia taxi]